MRCSIRRIRSASWLHGDCLERRSPLGFLFEGNFATTDAFYASDLGTQLRELGVFATQQTPGTETLHLLTDYEEYLRNARGLTEGVRQCHVNTLRALLAFHRSRLGIRPLRDFTGKDALGLFEESGSRYGCVGSRQKFAGELRQCLRFLHLREVIDKDLASTIPLFINYRLSTVPNHIPWDSIKRLVESADTSTMSGKRDRAILLLVAGLGLRPGAVRTLTLDQIHWRSAELRIPRTKSGRGLNLPLTDEAGKALSDYVLHGRPKTTLRTVFLSFNEPPKPLSSGSAISAMIAARLKRAGIPKVKGAANLLRHSLATHLVNGGVPIKQVSDVFGHASIDTTAIYTKVDITSLAMVPLPFSLGVVP